jgi:hypothetical protein
MIQMNNDQIIEMAEQVSREMLAWTPELIAFARLIAAEQREEDAQIVLSRRIGYAVDDYDLNTLAAAIRNSGGEK